MTTHRCDSFGALIATKSPGVTQPFTFTGREWDTETGLYDYRARYYDPTLGRFLSEDPIGFGGGLEGEGHDQRSAINPFATTNPLRR